MKRGGARRARGEESWFSVQPRQLTSSRPSRFQPAVRRDSGQGLQVLGDLQGHVVLLLVSARFRTFCPLESFPRRSLAPFLSPLPPSFLLWRYPRLTPTLSFPAPSSATLSAAGTPRRATPRMRQRRREAARSLPRQRASLQSRTRSTVELPATCQRAWNHCMEPCANGDSFVYLNQRTQHGPTVLLLQQALLVGGFGSTRLE